MTAAFPLHWPEGRPRTRNRAEAKFRDGNTGGKRVSLDLARDRLEDQLTRIGAADIVLSMNIRLTLTGRRDMNSSRTEPMDPGAALYFDLRGRPHVLACDRWDRTADNIAAIAAHIGALRDQQRWGVATLEQAFAGHVALPAPEAWWQILGIPSTATPAAIDAAWREMMRAAHPDHGGSNAAAARLNRARDEGKRANG